jgi:hypothetical protein
MKMTTDNRDTTIEDIHRIRREIAERFQGDIFAIVEDARKRQEASGRLTVSYSSTTQSVVVPTSELDIIKTDNPAQKYTE